MAITPSQSSPSGEHGADSSAPAPGRKKPPATKKALRWVVTILVVGAVGWLFSRSLIDNWEAVRAKDIGFSWEWVLATLAFALAVPVTGVAWGRILRWLDRDAQFSHREAIAVQCLSWVLKYIPGQVGSVANKVIWAGKKGISRTLVVITFLYENIFLQLASIVPAAVILLISIGPEVFGSNASLMLAPLLVLIPAIVLLYPPAFRALMSIPAKKVLKQEIPREYFLSAPRAALSSLEFILPRVVNGVGFVLIAHTVSDITPAHWLPFGAAYALAGAIGILAILVPSGLGVREAVIVIVLSQYVPVPEAVIISLLARLLATIGDALVALIYLITRRTLPKETRP
ncbi:flippase-like domain-containing protein [Brachybacterium sp. p3-SID1565]|uniref:Flippase-like domain-containing protein n=1 Tax=Brachybacterium epidermidis TaxID=2781983 RepID=A0ABR9VZ65_9MICO|nr:lysylphosphatidylglycerol synthase domain-containing protein [Brachybacterium sp. p3-SID1565]MBE9403478.1 flippase-like domain-containing protein [Brachybacterium epidermidis]MCT1385076.1 flippase-like domain-containing protein [Brachybacterium sp. p3-SID1565]